MGGGSWHLPWGGGTLRGSTSRILELEAVQTACWPRNARNGVGCISRARLLPTQATEPTARDPTWQRLDLTLMDKWEQKLVEFEGGLARACSRLGRRAGSTLPLGPLRG